MEDFWEGGVQDQGNALRQGFVTAEGELTP